MEKTSVYSGIPWNVNPRLSADNAAIFGVQKNLQARYWWYYLPASKCSSRVLIFSHETIYLFTYLGTFFPEIEKASRDAKTTFLSVLHFDLVLFAHFVLFLSGCGFFDNFDISLKGPRLFSYFFTFQFWTQSRVFAQFDCFCSKKQKINQKKFSHWNTKFLFHFFLRGRNWKQVTTVKNSKKNRKLPQFEPKTPASKANAITSGPNAKKNLKGTLAAQSVFATNLSLSVY